MIVGFTLFALVVSAILLLATFVDRRMWRYNAFFGYMNGLQYFKNEGLPVPDTIEAIEDAYNHFSGRVIDLPSPPWYLRPTYRPMTGLHGGPYLVFIETKPPGLQDWTRLAIFAYPDGQLEGHSILPEWKLAAMIAKDDELRRTDAATTTQNAMPVP